MSQVRPDHMALECYGTLGYAKGPKYGPMKEFISFKTQLNISISIKTHVCDHTSSTACEGFAADYRLSF
jgi:hypothetical protein